MLVCLLSIDAMKDERSCAMQSELKYWYWTRTIRPAIAIIVAGMVVRQTRVILDTESAKK